MKYGPSSLGQRLHNHLVLIDCIPGITMTFCTHVMSLLQSLQISIGRKDVYC